jgi:uncharacterized protein (DUF433 family)
MSHDPIIAAFSEEHASRLSGVSRAQLRGWDKAGLLKPSYAEPGQRGPFSRVYSFGDLVSLRVLNALRNVHKVSMTHLREVAEKLAHLGEQRWTATTLYVLGKRVVWDDPRDSLRGEVVDGQRVFAEIPLHVAVADTRKAIQDYNRRGPDEIGRVVRNRSIQGNQPVFAKTRIPVSAVQNFLKAGYGDAEIIRNYPELTSADITVARDPEPVAA